MFDAPSDTQTEIIFLHLAPDHLADAVEKLEFQCQYVRVRVSSALPLLSPVLSINDLHQPMVMANHVNFLINAGALSIL
jgi:hypothetical protein